MKTLLNKLLFPFIIFLFVNMIGFVYAKNYEGAVAGSLIGMLVAVLVLEIRAKIDTRPFRLVGPGHGPFKAITWVRIP